MVYQSYIDAYLHLDLLHNYNEYGANEMENNIDICLDKNRSNKHVNKVNCLQKNNGIDCGYFMLNNIRPICRELYFSTFICNNPIFL